MIQLSFLGAIQEVGRSGLLVDTGVEKIVLDYGTKVREVPQMFPIPVKCRPDAVFLSHSHLDHSGALALFAAKENGCRIYATDVTKPITELLLLDSVKIGHEEGVELPFTVADVKETVKNFVPTAYKKPVKLRKTAVTLFDAGHIPGSALVHMNFGGKSLLYTGDFKTTDTRLLNRAEENLPETNVLVTESTYAQREHPDRKSQEKELMQTIRETLSVDGVTVIAGFAVGRIDEILLVLDHYGIDYPVFVDGMAKKALTIINKHRNLLREKDELDTALKKVQYVKSENMRKRIIKNPCVVLTTSGMLSGGPIVWYLKKLFDDRNATLILTSYQVEGTPGRALLETGRFTTKDFDLKLRMLVKRLDFSSHLDRSELFDFVKKVNPQKVFCVHGDDTETFAKELREKGFDAVAPTTDNRIFEI